MSNAKIIRAAPALAACVGLVTGCGPGEAEDLSQADIANVGELESSFAPPFMVETVGPAAIDPRLLGPQTLPPGLAFDPADCGKSASRETLPQGVQGNMAATTAEGEGVRFIVIAVETSEPVPVNTPAEQCRKVTFTGAGVRGEVEVVDAPQIDGVHTVGTHRVLRTATPEGPRTGEIYNYVANFGNFIVIVTANPLVIADKPVAQVDTQRARDLVTQAVDLVKG
ncbi:DUF5642 family protein [Mycolicibacterium pyrenivorans]|uniref:DUF5642 family protein n=1 Tax=Mycolicibacterium pyrenivorans TaxID=187102 RepID=UPI0021F386BE|nr:DUF5642 family protein [Mycolicibacterium pyrenivorans]MCV7150060.1 DUF5642 family protein [Mycolicibacterium pyrenivorans]